MAITANTTVIVGSKKYQKGQTVTGLSVLDKEWMKKAGFISETPAGKEEKKTTKEESKDEL